jgi:hypothetical protein
MRLVLALKHADDRLHHFGVTRVLTPIQRVPAIALLAGAGPEERQIRSRWAQDALPAWRRIPPTLVCEIGYYLLDLSVVDPRDLWRSAGTCGNDTHRHGGPESLWVCAPTSAGAAA